MPSWYLARSSALSTEQQTTRLPAALDVEALLEVIFGAFFHRLLPPTPSTDLHR